MCLDLASLWIYSGSVRTWLVLERIRSDLETVPAGAGTARGKLERKRKLKQEEFDRRRRGGVWSR